MCPAGLCDSSESLLMRRETCTIISVCLGSLDHRRGSQIWFMICCLMARALALRGDQMTFSTGACQGRNGECTITTAWRREWERPPVLLRLNGGEMLLKSDGKMIPVNTAKGGGWSADTDDVMLREFWSLGKAANCFIKHIETMTDAKMQSNDLDVISCIISPNLSSTRRHESSIVSEVDMMVSPLNEGVLTDLSLETLEDGGNHLQHLLNTEKQRQHWWIPQNPIRNMFGWYCTKKNFLFCLKTIKPIFEVSKIFLHCCALFSNDNFGGEKKWNWHNNNNK